MKYLDLTLPTPAENLACDEALLDWCEAGGFPGGDEAHGRPGFGRSRQDLARTAARELPAGTTGILRFWESPEHFVVVGYANRVATEVKVAACEVRGILIYRRCSGGGTVLQGPGCLSYALVLPIPDTGPLSAISSANRFIMERNRAALAAALRAAPSAPAVRGHTDLVIGTRKFSGNSQRRRRRFLLFHGTFLLQADLALMGELLRMPSKQPDYRQRRSHEAFLTNITLTPDQVKGALRKAWSANSPLGLPPLDAIAALDREKYATREWNFKF